MISFGEEAVRSCWSDDALLHMGITPYSASESDVRLCWSDDALYHMGIIPCDYDTVIYNGRKELYRK